MTAAIDKRATKMLVESLVNGHVDLEGDPDELVDDTTAWLGENARHPLVVEMFGRFLEQHPAVAESASRCARSASRRRTGATASRSSSRSSRTHRGCVRSASTRCASSRRHSRTLHSSEWSCTSRRTPELANAMRESSLPALRELAVTTRWQSGPHAWPRVGPALRVLRLELGGIAAAVVEALVRDPVLRQLAELELAFVDNAIARVVLANAHLFAHLEKLVLTKHSVRAGVARELKSAIPGVELRAETDG